MLFGLYEYGIPGSQPCPSEHQCLQDLISNIIFYYGRSPTKGRHARTTS